MTLERIFKWLSTRILFIVSVIYIMAVLNATPYDFTDVIIQSLACLPGVILLVAAYRQLFKPRPWLVLSGVVLMTLMSIYAWVLFLQARAELKTRSIIPMDPDDPFALPEMDVRAMITQFIILFLILLIPLYSNFKRHWRNRSA